MRILKIFDGFVTNSYSVNFLIALREELTEEILEKYLYNHFKDKTFAREATKLFWKNINYDRRSEYESYELDCYEVTLDQGNFYYYPGDLPDEGLQYKGWFGGYPYYDIEKYIKLGLEPDDFYGLIIDEKDFKLCVGGSGITKIDLKFENTKSLKFSWHNIREIVRLESNSLEKLIISNGPLRKIR